MSRLAGVRENAQGDIIMVRYADDSVLGFQNKWDAKKYQTELIARLAKFGLSLNLDKTRLIRFGRFASVQCALGGGGKPETLEFLGFTHICTRKRNGEFRVGRITSRKRMIKQIKAVCFELRRRLHDPPGRTLAWLVRVLRGHVNYYSVPGNIRRVSEFRHQLVKRWYKLPRRRSQRTSVNWSQFGPWIDSNLPRVRVVHPYPEYRFCVNHSQ